MTCGWCDDETDTLWSPPQQPEAAVCLGCYRMAVALCGGRDPRYPEVQLDRETLP